MTYLVWIIVTLITAILSAIIAKRKGHDVWMWFFLGIIFSVLTLSIILAINEKKNTTIAEEVHND